MPHIKAIKHHKIVLDTHVWLWLMAGSHHLSKSFRLSIKKVQDYSGILISSISIWEIGMLVNRKRIELNMDPLDWISEALDFPGVRLIQLSPKIAIESTRLPGNIHGDPADRILVATAHEEHATLVTCDEKLLEYGKDNYISVFDPRISFDE
jgi:PIN domain nuclease of toxin-antitoxin system